MRIGIRIGAPLDFSRYEGMEEDRFVLRSITDEIMYELMLLSHQEYVDVYAASMKDRLVAAARAKAKELQREGHDRAAAAAAAQARAIAGTTATSEDPAATAGAVPSPAPPTGNPGSPGDASTDAGDERAAS
jgi:1-acyl-sn-glycerol-3-phosphate acyltransferase